MTPMSPPASVTSEALVDIGRPASTAPVWASLAIIAGGLLMAVLWFRYITLHGPTTFDEEGYWLGHGTEFWGSMMSAPSSLLIALGLFGHYSLLTGHAGRRARIGFVLIMIGLVVPSLLELAILAIAPPMLAPVTAIGLLLLVMDRGTRASLPRAARATLFLLVLLLTVSLLIAVIPEDTYDRIDAYRLYGIAAHVLYGAGWVVFGASLLRAERSSGRRRNEPPRRDTVEA